MDQWSQETTDTAQRQRADYSLPYLKRQAKELHRAVQVGEAAAYIRVKTHLSHLSDASEAALQRYIGPLAYVVVP